MKKSERYAALVRRAAQMNHKVRLTVYTGDPQDGDPLVYSDLMRLEPGQDEDLDRALDSVEDYLDSDKARLRAEMVERERRAVLDVRVAIDQLLLAERKLTEVQLEMGRDDPHQRLVSRESDGSELRTYAQDYADVRAARSPVEGKS